MFVDFIMFFKIVMNFIWEFVSFCGLSLYSGLCLLMICIIVKGSNRNGLMSLLILFLCLVVMGSFVWENKIFFLVFVV